VSPATESRLQPTAESRYESVDALRGLIMILMAIDHSSATIARQHSSEFWAGAMSAYVSALPFLTRLITHLCAPGFFFLMGAGIYWFSASRIQAGWTESLAARRVALRGLLIFGLAQISEAPVLFLSNLLKPAAVRLSRVTAPPPNDGSDLYWGLITFSGLGLVMIACALLLRARPWIWLATAAACVIATNSLLPASGKPGPLWQTILLAPGLSQHVIVVYPVIPWLAGAAAGMYFAWWWRKDPATAARSVWILGTALVATSLILRAAGGWGNIRLPRDSGWIEFLNNVKYPPSLVFWTLFLGVNLLLLAALPHLPKAWNSVLAVFGRAPLFFYLAHFYVLIAFAFVFFREAGSLAALYGMWIVTVVLLYPACRWFAAFKARTPAGSLWRML